MSRVRTRTAPSPTGLMHIGSLRTALYCYAFAKSQGGQFILRIEDTDQKRLVPGATEKICEILKFFGLNWDEGPETDGPFAPYIQSERVKTGIYKKYAEKLVKEDHAYYCFCPPVSKEEIAEVYETKKVSLRDPCRYLSKEEVKEKLKSGVFPAIRLKVPPDEVVTYHDFIIDKEISWETKNIDEVMLLKSDGFPTYHLAVVVDDVAMEISHVIRGHDWLSSTPVHLLVYKYLEFPLPQIGHLTDILDPRGGKLSKRKGSVSCEEFLAEGYLPEAILNFIMLLGWAPKDNRELFTLEEFVENFSKGNLQIANPVFNRQKLDWFNGIYLRKTQNSNLKSQIFEFYQKKYSEALIEKTIPLVRERMTKLSDYSSLAGFFFQEPKVDKSLLSGTAKIQLTAALEVLEKIEKWGKQEIETGLQDLVEKESWKTGEFFMNLRIALTGAKITPPITDSVVILGKEKTVKRLKSVL